MHTDMSKATATPTKKRGRPTVKKLKARPSITMDDDVCSLARKLASRDGMSFSPWLEQLVRNRIKEEAAQ